MPEPTETTPRKKPHRLLRWLLKLAIVVVVLAILLAIAVQAVLWSDLPRNIAIGQIQSQLGAKATIESLSISWLGHTKLHGLTLTLPLATSPVVKVSEVDVNHASVPLIAFTQKIYDVKVTGAEIDLREDTPGRWNVQQLVPVTQQQTAESSATPDVPNLDVDGAVLNITRADGKQGQLYDVAITGRKAGPLAYDVTAAIGEMIAARGQLSLTRELDHRLKLEVAGVPKGIEQLTGSLPQPIIATLEWTGRQTTAGVEGNLLIHGVQIENYKAQGSVAVSSNTDSSLALSPANLILNIPQGGIGEVKIESGKISVGKQIKIEQLLTELPQGRVATQGDFDPATFTGNLTAAWQQVQQKGMTTTGTANLRVTRELTGEIVGNAVLNGSVDTPTGSALGSVTIAGKGRSLDDLEGTIESEPLTWRPVDGKPIAVPALAGHLNARGSRLVLDSLKPRDSQAGEFLATAEFDRDSNRWWASVHTRELDVSQLRLPGTKLPVDLNVNADGNLSRFDVRQFYLKQGKTTLYLTGFYDGALPKPVQLDTWCWYSPEKEDDEDASFQGFYARGQLAGTLTPRALAGKGVIDARNLVLRDRPIGDISLDLAAELTDWHATFSTAEMKLLEGNWQMVGEWTAFTDAPPRVTVSWQNLSLPAMGEIAKVQGLEGNIDQGKAIFTIPSFRLKDWGMRSLTQATNLKFAGLQVDSLSIDSTLDHGSFIAKPVLKRGDGSVSAQLNATLATDQPIKLTADIQQWPAPSLSSRPWAADLKASLSGKVEALYLIAAKETAAQANLTGNIDRPGEHVGSLSLSASLQNTRVLIDKLSVQTLDGTADANASIDLTDLETLRLDLVFNKLKPTQLAWISPVLADVVGDYTGSFRVAPSTEERSLGPLRIDVAVTPESAGFRTISLGDTRLVAFAGYNAPNDWRLVTDDAEINLAGGKIKPFARLSRSPGRLPTQLLTADLSALQLSPIVRAFKDDKKEIVGEVTGQVKVFGSTRAVDALTAEADVRLTNSDLGNFGPVAAMYNVLHIGGGTQPNGSGHVSLRMEDGNINIASASYFNRGAYINGFGNISDVTKFPDAPLDLTLFGSLRPLRDINLPFFADADKLFSVIQASGTTIHAGGTLHDPKAEQVAFKELGETVQGVLLGKIKEDKEQ